ncbi:MAG: plasmid recombination protein, partial [Acetatifactor sp.]
FHELILQIGNREDMSAKSQEGQLAAQVLDEYMRDFQGRNPNLRVFSAHLHMDEATPHLHIDFVPFITGSKRGLDTRVSLKKALEAQGFSGGSRSDTEWNQWVASEKDVLASVMERHGIQWEQKGTHEKHLSVLDYQKQERAKEVAELETQKADIQERVDDLTDAYFRKTDEIEQIEDTLKSLQEKTIQIEAVEEIEAKPVPLTGKVMISKQDYDTLTTAAQKYVIQEKKEGKIQRLLDAANQKIQELLHVISDLNETIFSLNHRVSELENELSTERSFEKQFAQRLLEQENSRLRQENKRFRDVLRQHGLLPRGRERER